MLRVLLLFDRRSIRPMLDTLRTTGVPPSTFQLYTSKTLTVTDIEITTYIRPHPTSLCLHQRRHHPLRHQTSPHWQPNFKNDFFPTSLCGVLVFSSASRPPPPALLLPASRLLPASSRHTQLVLTHNLLTHYLLTHNLLTHHLLTHNFLTHNFLTHNLLTHNLHAHTTCTHTTYSHTTYSHTTYSHTTCSHTTCSHTTYTHTHNLLIHNLHTHTTCTHTTCSDTTYSHTTCTHLLRNIIANFCCGVHRSCTDNPYKLT